MDWEDWKKKLRAAKSGILIDEEEFEDSQDGIFGNPIWEYSKDEVNIPNLGPDRIMRIKALQDAREVHDPMSDEYEPTMFSEDVMKASEDMNPYSQGATFDTFSKSLDKNFLAAALKTATSRPSIKPLRGSPGAGRRPGSFGVPTPEDMYGVQIQDFYSPDMDPFRKKKRRSY